MGGNMKKAKSVLWLLLTTTVLFGCSTIEPASDEGVNVMELQSGVNRVYFRSGGEKIAGDLYLPADFDANKKYPSIIYTRPGSQVKEQTGSVYGKKLSERGYAFLVFDPANFGDSTGDLRNFETIHNMVPNTIDAISFFRTMKFVDRDKFYGLGVCAGGTYISTVALSDTRIKAVATVGGNFDAAAALFGGYPKETLDYLLKTVGEGRQTYYETGEYDTSDIFGGVREASDGMPASFKNALDYYFGRGNVPNYSSEYPNVTMPLDPSRIFVEQAKYLTQPFLVVAGSEAFTKSIDQKVFEIATEPKEYLEIEGAGHMDLYDIDEYVDQAIEAIDNFYNKY